MPRATPYPSQRPAAGAARRHSNYDCVIVGGGPAGLSAAIYLARFNRSVLVVDTGEGRSTSHETNENYLGFPRGIRSRDLRSRGCRQAARFGVEFQAGRATSIKADRPGFAVRIGRRVVHGRTLILATGVVDRFPEIDDIEKYVGISLFWCITCDGWKSRGKRVVIVGNSDEAATTALQFLNFTRDVSVITHADQMGISAKKREQLTAAGINIVAARVTGTVARGSRIQAVETSIGVTLPVEMLFSSMGCEPNTELARSLRLALNERYIKTDTEQRTSRRRVYAAGDVTKAFAHQIATAVHEGATAGQAANFDLYDEMQRG